ncbi:hypothetical protein FORC065_1576 [Yersinia enterocolitica]|nr:hypothetical protein FORC065_1576 [Yersinia enterocolitica]
MGLFYFCARLIKNYFWLTMLLMWLLTSINLKEYSCTLMLSRISVLALNQGNLLSQKGI